MQLKFLNFIFKHYPFFWLKYFFFIYIKSLFKWVLICYSKKKKVRYLIFFYKQKKKKKYILFMLIQVWVSLS